VTCEVNKKDKIKKINCDFCQLKHKKTRWENKTAEKVVDLVHYIHLVNDAGIKRTTSGSQKKVCGRTSELQHSQRPQPAKPREETLRMIVQLL